MVRVELCEDAIRLAPGKCKGRPRSCRGFETEGRGNGGGGRGEDSGGMATEASSDWGMPIHSCTKDLSGRFILNEC